MSRNIKAYGELYETFVKIQSVPFQLDLIIVETDKGGGKDGEEKGR